jgi:hypothetical protein
VFSSSGKQVPSSWLRAPLKPANRLDTDAQWSLLPGALTIGTFLLLVCWEIADKKRRWNSNGIEKTGRRAISNKRNQTSPDSFL